MRLLIHQDYNKASKWTANYIASKIKSFGPTRNKPFVLGLPTGSSPLGVYAELIRLVQKGDLSFAHVVTFNMDEYVGIPENHPQSYHRFMYDNLFSHIDILPENIHILNGNAPDLEKECEDYENAIASHGGINLFLGGIGPDGHIAFNEPGSSLSSKTRIKALTYDTLVANSRFFDNDISKVPKTALTVGVGTVMASSEVLIIACGYNKARALQKVIEEGVNHMWTASVLQMHPKGIVVCDVHASMELKAGTVKYFIDIEKGQLDQYR